VSELRLGQPPCNITSARGLVRPELSENSLHEWVEVPPQGKMATPYLNSIATSYDAKKRHYVQTGTDNEGFWWVSYAEPWTGNTEHWTNHASSDDNIRRYTWVRTNRNTFSFTEYPSLTATKPDFRGTCIRSS
jgi:hypothetical protein